MIKKDKYDDGMNMDIFKHIPEISWYNNNYYVGIGGDLLFASSCDFVLYTEWWIIDPHWRIFTLLGYSNINDEKLTKSDRVWS